MGTPTADDSAQRGRRGPRAGFLLIASVLVHGIAFVVLARMPMPERYRPIARPYRDVELIEFEIAELPAAPAGQPGGGAPVAEPLSDEPAPAEPSSPSEPAPRKPSSPVPTEQATPGSSGVTMPAEPAPAPKTGGLGLLGMRNQTGSGGSGNVPGPVVDPSAIERPGVPLPAPVGPMPSPPPSGGKDNPRSLQEAGFKRRRNGELVYLDKGWRFSAKLHPSGRLDFRDLPGKPGAMPGLSEAARAAAGEELYRNEKKALLERTFELRLAMAVSWAERQMEGNLARLTRDLLELWQQRTRPAVDRRREIFERWDECEEAIAIDLPDFGDKAKSKLDEARQSAGARARDEIEQFVRRHLPAGTEDAYPASELEALNRKRQSRERFEPYRRGGSSG